MGLYKLYMEFVMCEKKKTHKSNLFHLTKSVYTLTSNLASVTLFLEAVHLFTVSGNYTFSDLSL